VAKILRHGYRGAASEGNQIKTGASGKLIEHTGEIIFAYVQDTILDPSNPKFHLEDKTTSVGTIQCIPLNQATTTQTQRSIEARPLNANINRYPVKHEIVLIIKCIEGGTVGNTREDYFYIGTVNALNSPNYNGGNSYLPEQDFKWKGEDGETFEPVDAIVKLLHNDGDVVFEGGFGNAIRLGSTAQEPSSANQWSLDGADGDPIIIITNGFNGTPIEGTDGKVIIESVDDDSSSMYFTGGQSIPLSLSNNLPTGIDPTNSFVGNQVVINSDRLVFNARGDSVILSGAAQIALCTPEWKVDVTLMMDAIKAIATELDALCTGKATLTTGVGPTGPGTNAGNTTKILSDLGMLEQ
tara:strand:+ start:2000 stop:3061 length:1062 start_codon:yes stop_codon:yes gene_type:complete